MVLAQKQTYRSMEQNREPRNKPTLIWLIILQQKASIYNGKKTTSSINGVQKTGQSMCKRMKLHHYLISYKELTQNEF